MRTRACGRAPSASAPVGDCAFAMKVMRTSLAPSTSAGCTSMQRSRPIHAWRRRVRERVNCPLHTSCLQLEGGSGIHVLLVGRAQDEQAVVEQVEQVRGAAGRLLFVGAREAAVQPPMQQQSTRRVEHNDGLAVGAVHDTHAALCAMIGASVAGRCWRWRRARAQPAAPPWSTGSPAGVCSRSRAASRPPRSPAQS
jgi:hypothetical protein